jgi:hypothetical protein
MISLLEIAHSMNEADDDKYVSIGFGRFKLKGKEDDDDADVYAKTDSGEYVKSADQKSDDDGGEKPEQPQGGKLSGSDFERDLDSDDNEESDDVEISDANSGPIDTDDITDMLKNDSEVVDKMGDDVYWDGMDLVSSKYDDDTIASIPDDASMTLADLKKQIMDYEGDDDNAADDEADDMDRDARFDADDDEDDEKNAPEKENEQIEKELQDIAKDKGLTVGSEEANHGGEIHGLVGKDDDPDNVLGFHAAPKFDDDGNETGEVQYAIELGMGSSSNFGAA